MIALLLSETGRIAAALAAAVVPSAHAQEAHPPSIVQPDPTVPDLAPIKWEPLPEERRCIRTWRTAWYAAQALDLGTTVAGIESGKGREGNPVYRLMFGKRVKSWEVAAVKAVSIGATEWSMARASRRGEYGSVCGGYKLGAGLIGGVALLNLRIVF